MRNATLAPLATTLTVQALVSMAVITVPVLAPEAASETGVSASYAGIFIALVYGASMASSLVSGPLVQRFGAIRISQACLVACAIGLASVAAGTLPLFIVSALLLGAGYGPVTPASSHILAKTAPPERMALIFSLKQTGVPIGGALAGALVPTLVLWSGWRMAALWVACACLVTAILTQPMRKALDADRNPRKPLAVASLAGPLRYTLGNPDLRRLALCSLCFAALQLCLMTFLVTYLMLDTGLSLVSAGMMLMLAQVGGAIARVAWGAVSDRWGRPTRVLGGMALAMGAAAVATAGFSAQWPNALIAVVCVAFGATAVGWNGVYLAQVARLAPPGKAGDATGGALAFTYAGVLFGPPLFTLLVGWGAGYAAAYVLLAVPSVVCGLVLLWHGHAAGQRAPGVTGKQ
ncbi:MFS transporter [Candidimonas nitroreducens]|uniref:MFS transporter n=1 Tax=Candidimonas nitroreducens TaxID=683354 RepID=A0A225MRV7_9BURK|nr:MFS transporter [Candidimonas nitroreducens]OWT63994.1 MFS transporter [Candidimonas nitroreducens]